MANIDHQLLQRARDGDENAIIFALPRYSVDPGIIEAVARLLSGRGRSRDPVVFMNLVNARKHYVKRGWRSIPKAVRIRELIDIYGLSPNVADHIANGKGYADVRKEAHRQLMAEAEEAESHF